MNTSSFAEAPLLLSLSRGNDNNKQPIVECVHRGFIAVIDGNKQSLMSIGSDCKTHMRSTAKPFQVMPLLEDSASLALDLKDIALFMSSHSGETFHTERVQNILARSGLSSNDLRCGVHPPQSMKARFDLWQRQEEPSVLHNNCSGKHAAMLLCCKQSGFENDYERIDHPLQQHIKSTIAAFAEEPVEALDAGIDGCSMPSYSLPLSSIAYAYARLASWPDGPYSKSCELLWHAATENPEFIAGTRRFDTELMRVAKGALLSKTGADGMHAIAVKPCQQYPHGLGIAIKIVDGDASQKIRPALVKEVLSRLNLWKWDDSLDGLLPSLTNYRGQTIGSMFYHF